jgi:hypothetical protein
MTPVEVIAVITPFVLAYIIQWLSRHMRELANGVLRLTLKPEEEVTGFAKECAIELAVKFYGYVSFIVSILISTVSALAYVLQAKVQFLAYFIVVVFIVELLFFFLRWHPMNIPPGIEEAKKRSREMSYASVLTTTGMMIVTVAAKLL